MVWSIKEGVETNSLANWRTSSFSSYLMRAYNRHHPIMMTNDGRVSWVTLYPCELIVHSVIAAPALGRAYTTLLLYDMPDD